jgi:hypothetical protein
MAYFLRMHEMIDEIVNDLRRGYSCHGWGIGSARTLRELVEQIVWVSPSEYREWLRMVGVPSDEALTPEEVFDRLVSDEAELERFLGLVGWAEVGDDLYARKLPGLCALAEIDHIPTRDEALAIAREAARDLGGVDVEEALFPLLAIWEGEWVGYDENSTDGRVWPLFRPTRVVAVWETGEDGRRIRV